MKKLINKISFGVLSAAMSVQAFAYQSTGTTGVDETTSLGVKIGYALLFIGGLASIISGFWKLGSEQKNGKIVAAGFIGLGIIAWGVLGLWVSKMSGFAF
jgi:hypothetical protein